jgi:hypothetical protein
MTPMVPCERANCQSFRKAKMSNGTNMVNPATTPSGVLTRMTAQMESQIPKTAAMNKMISPQDRSFVKFMEQNLAHSARRARGPQEFIAKAPGSKDATRQAAKGDKNFYRG